MDNKRPLPPNPLREEARRLRLKKRFAQHFLTDRGVLDRIAATLELQPDETVLEIGPGAGFLTERLLAQAGSVVAVELERKMVAYLASKFHAEDRLTLIGEDILRFDPMTIEAERLKIVGNLPYNITSPILFHLCGELQTTEHPLRQRMERLVIMVQREVGERITARPGQKAYNQLTVAVQMWFDARLDFLVPAHSFYPPPKVESAVLTLTPRTAPRADVADLARFGALVRAAFSQKRKTVRNALLGAQFAPPDVLDTMFTTADVDPGLRAEAISIEAFGSLANAIALSPR